MRFSIVAVFLMMSGMVLNGGEPRDIRPVWLALSVADANAIAGWYQEHLGFHEVDRLELPQRKMLIIFLKAGDFMLEIAQRADSVDPESRLGVGNKSQVRGLYKFGFRVENLEAKAAEMRKAGVNFHGELFDDERFGVKTVIVKDVEGNLVQLFQELKPSQ